MLGNAKALRAGAVRKIAAAAAASAAAAAFANAAAFAASADVSFFSCWCCDFCRSLPIVRELFY